MVTPLALQIITVQSPAAKRSSDTWRNLENFISELLESNYKKCAVDAEAMAMAEGDSDALTNVSEMHIKRKINKQQSRKWEAQPGSSPVQICDVRSLGRSRELECVGGAMFLSSICQPASSSVYTILCPLPLSKWCFHYVLWNNTIRAHVDRRSFSNAAFAIQMQMHGFDWQTRRLTRKRVSVTGIACSSNVPQ